MQRMREAALPVSPDLWAGLAALADPVRLRVILLLRHREQCVCHLTEALALSQGTISHHMAVLRRAGLVRDRRDPSDSRWVYYRIDPEALALLRSAIGSLLDTTGIDPTPASCCGNGSPSDHC